MLRGLYTSGLGMKVQSKLNDVTAANMANVNTIGYKKDTGVVTSFPDVLLHRIGGPDSKDKPSRYPTPIGYLSTGALLHETLPSVRVAGNLQETNNPLDLSIIGNGYFVVETAAGEELYSKQGNFKLNEAGMLVTNDGNPVLGTQGRIFLTGTIIDINSSGEVYQDGSLVDNLRLVKFVDETGNDNDNGLEKVGNTLLRHPNQEAVVPATNIQVKQGFLESSNVNPVQEMVNLIQVMRAYEVNQKAVQAHEQTLEKAVNEVGRI